MSRSQNIIIFALLTFFVFQPFCYSQITPSEAIARMNKGINLGNTLEPEDEGGWNNPKVQEYYFDMYRDAGFSHVRIPVRWDKHTATTPPYSIDPEWLNRVEQIIDWGLERNLFIILNAHHDEWIMKDYTEKSNRDRFDSIWSQVATRFRNKPENLIFEILNEPNGIITKSQTDDLHKRVLAVIRKTNPVRLVIYQGNNWGGSDALIQAAVPDDEYMIGSFHSYDPYYFGLEGLGTWGSEYDRIQLRNKFVAVKNWSNRTGIPVILGEFGSLRSCDYNSRMRHYRAYVELSHEFGFAPTAWDDGGNFRIMERQQHGWNELKDILIYCSEQSPVPQLKFNQADTSLSLSWTSTAENYDSIIIEKRTSLTAYKRLTVMIPGTDTLNDKGITLNQACYYRIILHYNESEDLYSQPISILPSIPDPEPDPERLPYPGQAHEVPGIIEAEDYDIGGEGFTYHDTDEINKGGYYRLDEGVDIFNNFGLGGYQLTGIATGEWTEYSINVRQAGNYYIHTVLSSEENGGSFMFTTNNNESGVVNVEAKGSWLETSVNTTSIYLEQGTEILKFIVLSTPQFSVDKFELELNTTGTDIYKTTDNNLKVFRNENGNISWFSDHERSEKLELYDLTGKCLKYYEITGTSGQISARDIPPGVYIIRTSQNNQQSGQKVIL